MSTSAQVSPALSGNIGLLDVCLHSWAEQLATLAVNALRNEALLTPKPALVDQRGPGAHTDLNLALMIRSAHSLLPCFRQIGVVASGAELSRLLVARLVELGRVGERDMLTATGGVNTHRGAIWALGLLVAGAAICGRNASVNAIAGTAAHIAELKIATTVHNYAEDMKNMTKGRRACLRFGVTGALGEAISGFPHVIYRGLPQLRRTRLRGVPTTFAALDTLLKIMTTLDDTCLLHRGGMEALAIAQRGATAALDAGGSSAAAGMQALLKLDAELRQRNISPGGSADLLAATIFLDSIEEMSILIPIASKPGATHTCNV